MSRPISLTDKTLILLVSFSTISNSFINNSENEKIKYSLVGLSDEAIKELYACIHHYLKNVL